MRCLCSGLGVVSMYASLKQCVLRALRACVQGRCRRKTKNGSGVKIRDIFSVQRVARSAMINKDVRIRLLEQQQQRQKPWRRQKATLCEEI